ncbi:kinase-like domain-containing protein, partial [Gorgonomyces haynaldii]
LKEYELYEVLGKGGFGTVYRAQTNNTQVAIKLINKQQMKQQNLTRRVANEVEVHWQLRHPSILELYNYFEDAEYVYLVMELCENGELYKYLKQRDPLTEQETRGIMHQLVKGLHYLHSNGIIHRDLKLSNMLLSRQMDLKIADFGLAVKMKDQQSEQKTMCGTPNYISPEIVARQPYGLASDVWSVGCMMVTLLTGSPPFQTSAVKSTLDRISREDYRIPEHWSPSTRDLVSQLLQKEAKNRPSLDQVLQHPFFQVPSAPLKSLSMLPQKPKTPKSVDRPLLPKSTHIHIRPIASRTIYDHQTQSTHTKDKAWHHCYF